MKLRTFAFAVVAAGCVVLCWRSTSPVAASEPAAPANTYTLKDIAFITGAWEGELFGGFGEETWLAPKGGTMIGCFRLTHGERTTITEFLLIQETDAGVVYRFKHFSPDYQARETTPLTFRLTDVKGRRAVFTSEDEYQKPYKLIYTMTDDGLDIQVLELKDGEETGFTAKFARLK